VTNQQIADIVIVIITSYKINCIKKQLCQKIIYMISFTSSVELRRLPSIPMHSLYMPVQKGEFYCVVQK